MEKKFQLFVGENSEDSMDVIVSFTTYLSKKPKEEVHTALHLIYHSHLYSWM
jgi:hypothetical protein